MIMAVFFLSSLQFSVAPLAPPASRGTWPPLWKPLIYCTAVPHILKQLSAREIIWIHSSPSAALAAFWAKLLTFTQADSLPPQPRHSVALVHPIRASCRFSLRANRGRPQARAGAGRRDADAHMRGCARGRLAGTARREASSDCLSAGRKNIDSAGLCWCGWTRERAGVLEIKGVLRVPACRQSPMSKVKSADNVGYLVASF